MPEGEKKIYLENTHRRPGSDDELAELLGIERQDHHQKRGSVDEF